MKTTTLTLLAVFTSVILASCCSQESPVPPLPPMPRFQTETKVVNEVQPPILVEQYK